MHNSGGCVKWFKRNVKNLLNGSYLNVDFADPISVVVDMPDILQ